MQQAESLLIGCFVLIWPLLLPAIYFHDNESFDRRDAALVLPWALVITALMAQTALTASTFAFPLRDELWRSFDQHLGIHVNDLVAWVDRDHRVQMFFVYCYASLQPMVVCAVLLPALFGKRVAAQRFVLANAFGILLALPCMVMLPAIGPWVAWHFTPDPGQRVCESMIHALRGGTISHDTLFGSTVCLPSFHTFWAVIAAQALQPFRVLRVVAIVLAVLIVFSTMTTGWHYAVDVIAGLMLAAISIALATLVLKIDRRGLQA